MEPFSFSVELIKQNSTFLEEFNSSLKISGGTQAPPAPPPAMGLCNVPNVFHHIKLCV